MSDSHQAQSPIWGTNTKRIVCLVMVAILALLAWRFLFFIVVAAVLAYMFNPVISFLSERTFLSRGAAVWITYLLLGLVVLGGTGAIGVAAYTQISSLLAQLPRLISDVFDLVKQYVTNPETAITIGSIRITPYTFNWGDIENQILQMVNPVIGQSSQVITQVAGGAFQVAGGAFNVGGSLFVTFFVSIYFAQEMPKRGQQLNSLAHQLGYGEDFEHLSHRFNRIWNAYLRGQIVLAIVVGLITSTALAILGVQNSLALGILAGILQVIPYVGSIVAIALTALVALFQTVNYFGLLPIYYTLLVMIVLIVLQNLQAILLLPRVVGVALDLNPLLVFLSLIAGGTLAGISGVFLAAPVVATAKLLGLYVWHKLLDQPPFPEPEIEYEPPPPALFRLRDWLNRLRDWLNRLRGKPSEQQPSE